MIKVTLNTKKSHFKTCYDIKSDLGSGEIKIDYPKTFHISYLGENFITDFEGEFKFFGFGNVLVINSKSKVVFLKIVDRFRICYEEDFFIFTEDAKGSEIFYESICGNIVLNLENRESTIRCGNEAWEHFLFLSKLANELSIIYDS